MSNNVDQSKCQFCGGRMCGEYIGNYGDTYYLNRDGSVSTRRKRRLIYEYDGSEPMIYCFNCGREPRKDKAGEAAG